MCLIQQKIDIIVRKAWFWFLVLCFLNFLDVLFTYWFVRDDFSLESNPGARWVLCNWGYLGLYLWKTLLLIFVLFFCVGIAQYRRIRPIDFNVFCRVNAVIGALKFVSFLMVAVWVIMFGISFLG